VSETTGVDRALLRDGDAILLIDRKGREYLRLIRAGTRLPLRGGALVSDDLIGRPEGIIVDTARGERYLLVRPTYAQLIPNLPRRAQPIYPKDVGPILLWGDIGPGSTVVEVGTGPGALTIGLLRAVGPTGRVTSYEVRTDFAEMTRENVERFHGPAPHWTLRVGDAFAGIIERDIDRLVADLAEPWRLLDVATLALRSGGMFISFVPTVLQVKELVDALRAHGGYATIEVLETLLRPWHVRDRSVRPEHRMVAHTGFLVFARRLAPGVRDISELTPSERDGSPNVGETASTPGSGHDDEGGDPPEDLADT
jgi:tRNA (adenine57-N1/adenine58-N1)-methyltransferase